MAKQIAESGGAIEGALILPVRIPHVAFDTRVRLALRGTSAADGSFRIDALPPGARPFMARF